MLVIEAKTGEPLRLGREGENLSRQIVFNLVRWEKLYGPGVAQLIAQRTGEDTPYPVNLTLEGSNAIWNVTNADTAIHGLGGKAELRYYVGETLAKSETWNTIVLDALGEPSEEPPEPHKGWFDQVLQAGTDAQNAAERAELAATRQPIPNAETGTWWVWNGETGEYEDTGEKYQGGVTSWNDLTDKPFWEEPPAFDIQWDGDMTDREALDLTSVGAEGAYLVKVSDKVLTAEDLVGATVTMTVIATDETHSMVVTDSDFETNSFPGTLLVADSAMAIVHTAEELCAAFGLSDGAITNGTYFVCAPGVLHTSALTAASKIVPIDEKFIPSNVPHIQSATVGQFLTVKAVDENGKPTEWGASDLPIYNGEVETV